MSEIAEKRLTPAKLVMSLVLAALWATVVNVWDGPAWACFMTFGIVFSNLWKLP